MNIIRLRTLPGIIPALLLAVTLTGRASTITDPGVIITLQEGNATVSWNASVTGAALVEHSQDLSGRLRGQPT
jgi:hypothetical protein